MPLVVPGITSNPKDKTEEWSNKLVGKTLHDSESNETVGVLAWIASLVSANTHGTVLLQARPAPGDAHHRARHDGDQGL
jgi:hypothetical protein